MTGDDGMRVLGLNLDSPYSTCTGIMVKNGRGWLEGRLQHYQDLSGDELFRPEGKELAEAPTRGFDSDSDEEPLTVDLEGEKP